ncbi:MAG: TolC family protein, partial [Bacteroidales bacterium]
CRQTCRGKPLIAPGKVLCCVPPCKKTSGFNDFRRSGRRGSLRICRPLGAPDAPAQTPPPSRPVQPPQLEIEAKQKEIYQLQSLPDIFTYGTGSWEHGYIPFGDNFNYNIGVGVSYTIPLWGGSAHKTKIKQSKLLAEQIEYEKEQDFQDIKEEIDIALNEIRTIKDDIYDNKKIIDLANETLDNAMVKYRGGQGTIIDVLDAQTILTKAAIDFRKSTVTYLQTIAKLHYLTGNNNYPF